MQEIQRYIDKEFKEKSFSSPQIVSQIKKVKNFGLQCIFRPNEICTFSKVFCRCFKVTKMKTPLAIDYF